MSASTFVSGSIMSEQVIGTVTDLSVAVGASVPILKNLTMLPTATRFVPDRIVCRARVSSGTGGTDVATGSLSLSSNPSGWTVTGANTPDMTIVHQTPYDSIALQDFNVVMAYVCFTPSAVPPSGGSARVEVDLHNDGGTSALVADSFLVGINLLDVQMYQCDDDSTSVCSSIAFTKAHNSETNLYIDHAIHSFDPPEADDNMLYTMDGSVIQAGEDESDTERVSNRVGAVLHVRDHVYAVASDSANGSLAKVSALETTGSRTATVTVMQYDSGTLCQHSLVRCGSDHFAVVRTLTSTSTEHQLRLYDSTADPSTWSDGHLGEVASFAATTTSTPETGALLSYNASRSVLLVLGRVSGILSVIDVSQPTAPVTVNSFQTSFVEIGDFTNLYTGDADVFVSHGSGIVASAWPASSATQAFTFVEQIESGSGTTLAASINTYLATQSLTVSNAANVRSPTITQIVAPTADTGPTYAFAFHCVSSDVADTDVRAMRVSRASSSLDSFGVASDIPSFHRTVSGILSSSFSLVASSAGDVTYLVGSTSDSVTPMMRAHVVQPGRLVRFVAVSADDQSSDTDTDQSDDGGEDDSIATTPSDKSLSVGAIVGIAMGVIAMIAIIVATVYYTRYQKHI